jgi:hypothetical protein
MGSLERRIQQLEELYHASPGDPDPDGLRLAEQHDALMETAQRVRAKAEREAAEGDYGRLDALEELEAFIRQRNERGS